MATRDRIRLLQTMPFFGAINDKSVELILSQSEVCQIPAGDYLYRQGDQGDCLYVLEKGRVDILKELEDIAAKLCTIEEGGCFGELALIACTPRSAAARAATECQVIRIHQSALHNLYKEDVEQFLLLQMNMAREVCRRLQEVDDQWVQHQFEELSRPQHA